MPPGPCTGREAGRAKFVGIIAIVSPAFSEMTIRTFWQALFGKVTPDRSEAHSESAVVRGPKRPPEVVLAFEKR